MVHKFLNILNIPKQNSQTMYEGNTTLTNLLKYNYSNFQISDLEVSPQPADITQLLDKSRRKPAAILDTVNLFISIIRQVQFLIFQTIIISKQIFHIKFAKVQRFYMATVLTFLTFSQGRIKKQGALRTKQKGAPSLKHRLDQELKQYKYIFITQNNLNHSAVNQSFKIPKLIQTLLHWCNYVCFILFRFCLFF
eukprot:TRINITY_DN11846_c0_g1_i2.p2 TRINITY_DN11846_c0_g1~~TRINITY_DN11846_c0_g1_i2.p2  ORF type:complete len:194 (-),score=-10.98 TRINITY_DN11846_c0_g1_i2:22-603(-)